MMMSLVDQQQNSPVVVVAASPSVADDEDAAVVMVERSGSSSSSSSTVSDNNNRTATTGPGPGSRHTSSNSSSSLLMLSPPPQLQQEQEQQPKILRVRVINQQSKRSKEILVEIPSSSVSVDKNKKNDDDDESDVEEEDDGGDNDNNDNDVVKDAEEVVERYKRFGSSDSSSQQKKQPDRESVVVVAGGAAPTVYDAIYDHPAVKKAHVRKWSQDVVRKIKQQQQQQQRSHVDDASTYVSAPASVEIQCAVWDDVVDQPVHTFTIDEIKTMTTTQLYRLVPESDMIKFVLMFVENNSSNNNTNNFLAPPSSSLTSTTKTDAGAAAADQEGSKNRNQDGNDKDGDDRGGDGGIYFEPLHSSFSSSRTTFSARAALMSSSSSGVFRCPFSGVIVDESLVKDIDEHVQEQRSMASIHTATSMSAGNSNNNNDDNNDLSRGPASGAGAGASSALSSPRRLLYRHSAATTSPQQPTSVHSHRSMPARVDATTADATAAAVAADADVCGPRTGTGPGSVASAANTYSTHNTYLTPRSIHTLESITNRSNGNSSNSISDQGTAASGDPENNLSLSLPNNDDSLSRVAALSEDTSSIQSGADYYSQQLSQMEMRSTMRIRISNKSTKRSKDVVVEIKSDLNVYDAVYDNPGVKSAHVRKWGSDVVRDVKRKTSEIRCLVILGGGDNTDENDGYVSRSYTVDDLKSTSTLDLFELAPDSDPIQLVLQCVKKKSLVERVQKRWNGVGSDKSNRALNFGLERARLQGRSPKMPSSRSDPSLFLSGRRPPRPNHMNLSAMRNSTFATSTTAAATYEPEPDIRSRLSSLRNQNSTSLESPKKKESSGDDNTRKPEVEMEEDYVAPIKDQDRNASSTNRRDVPPVSFSSMRPSRSLQRQRSDPSPSTAALLATSLAKDFIDPFSDPPCLSNTVEDGDLTVETDHARDHAEKYTHKSPLKEQNKGSPECETDQEEGGGMNNDQIEKFLRLCRSKKSPDQLSDHDLRRLIKSSQETQANGAPNASFGQNDVVAHSPLNATFKSPKQPPRKSYSASAVPIPSPGLRPGKDVGREAIASLDMLQSPSAPKISRFLEFSRDKLRHSECNMSEGQSLSVGPPVAEIAVVRGTQGLAPPPAPVASPGISMSSETMNEVFPYNIIIDESFRVLQVGNSLSLLLDSSCLLGRPISDVLTITGPIPTFGEWSWKIMDKMKDKTVFLESIMTNSSGEKAKIKGTMIELSKEPRQVMFALFPNVKNLTELEKMNLSMADLPLHSCQREAVLLGEHSRSEVKLTNHLDHLHRDLINSMEKQIKDRTNELALANKELEDANTRLAVQSARQLEHFACMSHEIRTPLNCIVGMSSLLLEESNDTQMDPMHADSIRMINTSGELLKAVVDDVLDYAKLESGSFEVDIQPTKLQYALDSVVHSISEKVKEKFVRIRTFYSPMIPEMIKTDSRRLQQVLFNLLGNAGKFSKENSVIDLSVSLVTTEQGDMIRFSVRDYGKGISKSDYESIFMPFSQASKETQAIYGGTGLGLSITSKLVHRLGGEISVDSELGKYADFTVDLPMNDQKVDIESTKEKLGGLTIVLVQPSKEYDYSFTSFPVPEEPPVIGQEAIDLFGLNVVRCNDLEEVNDKLASSGYDQTKHIGLLVHETSYNPKAFHKLHSILGSNKYTLMTHGPNYLVTRTKDRHFKSLTGIFTITLLNSIAEFVGNKKPAPETSQAASGSVGEHLSGMTGPSSSQVPSSPVKGRDSAPAASSARSPVNSATSSGGLFASLGPPLSQSKTSETSTSASNSPGGLFASLKTPGLSSDGPKYTREVSDTATPSSQKTTDPVLSKDTNDSATTLKDDKSALASNSFPAPSTSSSQATTTIEKLDLKVLYAEDNLINQKVLSRVLQRTGIHDTTIVDNGKKAVDSCAETKYDVIFLDMQMPVMDGMEACELIMKRDPTSKIVFVTAHALDEFRERAEAAGATSFISKPFRVSDIKDVLQKIGKI